MIPAKPVAVSSAFGIRAQSHAPRNAFCLVSSYHCARSSTHSRIQSTIQRSRHGVGSDDGSSSRASRLPPSFFRAKGLLAYSKLESAAATVFAHNLCNTAIKSSRCRKKSQTSSSSSRFVEGRMPRVRNPSKKNALTESSGSHQAQSIDRPNEIQSPMSQVTLHPHVEGSREGGQAEAKSTTKYVGPDGHRATLDS